MNKNQTSLSTIVMRYADVFLSLIDTRSFQHSAQQLGITQSAVSQKIAQLEANLKITLFDRSTRPLTITPEARQLKESIDLYKNNLDETIQRIQYSNYSFPNIYFGMNESMIDCMGIDLMNSLSKKTHKLVLLMGTTDSLLRKLRRNEIDVIVTSGDLSNETDLQKQELFYEPSIVIVPKTLSISSEQCDLQNLSMCGLPLIRSPNESASGKYISNFLSKTSIHFPNQYEIDSNSLQLEMVERGLGWTISYPSAFLREEKRWGNVRFEVLKEGPYRKISVASRQTSSRMIQAMMRTECQHLLKTIVLPKILRMISQCKTLIGVLDYKQ